VTLVALVKQIRDAHHKMVRDGMDDDRARAVTTYLAMAFGRHLNCANKFARWESQVQRTKSAIGDRQALKMVYDFPEINPFAKTEGCLTFALDREVFCIKKLATVRTEATVVRGNAERLPYEDETFDAVITDPPYYSSIFYADLSAFFYVWHRHLYPEDFVTPLPPKRREAVAQPSEYGGDEQRANEHYREMMERSFVEAHRVLKPGRPVVCVYAHKTTEGWASLIKALVPAGLMVTEAWPIQTESAGRMNTLKAAALSDSIFFVARGRESSNIGQYETEVLPELDQIARERVATLWQDGKGIGGADLLMAAVGAGLRAYTQFARVERANGEELTAEQYLREVEGVVLDTMLEQVFGMSKAGVSAVDPLTRFYVLWRFTYRESAIEAGEAFVFCYPQGIEIDGPSGISGPLPKLVEKSGKTYVTG
jgi:putative DNA methylase